MKKTIEHSKFVNRFSNETGLSIPEITRLFEIEKKLSLYNERECSEEMTANMQKVLENNREKLELEVKQIIKGNIRFRSLNFNTDPRGPAIRFTMVSGWYNCPDQTLALDLE